MALLYAASAVGVAFAGDMLSFFYGGKPWPSPLFSKFGVGGASSAEEAGFRYLLFHVSSGLITPCWYSFPISWRRRDALSLTVNRCIGGW